MASSARIFFAGIGTTFAIIAAGFGGGLMFAKSALDAPAAHTRAADPVPPARVILPTTVEAALPRPEVVPVPTVQPAQPAQPPTTVEARVPEKQIDKEVERRKAAAQDRERKRYAERKARRIAEARARQPVEQPQQRLGILAFDDGPPRMGGFFGN